MGLEIFCAVQINASFFTRRGILFKVEEGSTLNSSPSRGIANQQILYTLFMGSLRFFCYSKMYESLISG
jgi:hypothetical protein